MWFRLTHTLILGAIVTSIGAAGELTINYPTPDPMQVAVETRFAELTEGRHCTPEAEPRLVDRIIVHFYDTPIVEVRTFDDAYDLASKGRVEIFAYCD